MIRLATAAMGTRFEIALCDIDDRLGPVNLRAAGELAIQEIEDCHRRLSRFAADSLVSHINRSAAASAVRLDADTFALMSDAIEVWRASDGAFDMTAGSRHVSGHGSESIELDEPSCTIRFAAPGISIDLGGIAKGHALDCAAARLHESGVTSALLQGGTSSVTTIGRPSTDSSWRVALGATETADVVSLRDLSLSVSDAGSQRDAGGASHIVDPRSSSTSRRLGAKTAVIGASARLADAWSTALVVLGAVPPGFPTGYDARFFDMKDVKG